MTVVESTFTLSSNTTLTLTDTGEIPDSPSSTWPWIVAGVVGGLFLLVTVLLLVIVVSVVITKKRRKKQYTVSGQAVSKRNTTSAVTNSELLSTFTHAALNYTTNI